MKEDLIELWKNDGCEEKLVKLINISNDILEKITTLTEDNCGNCFGEYIDDKAFFEYTFNGKKCAYDPDSSSVAWMYYEKMYEAIKKELKCMGKGKIYRIVGSFKYENKKIIQTDYQRCLEYIEIGGDCVFNFSKSSGKYSKFIKIIEKDENIDKRKILFSKLELCSMMHHSPYNFALMPSTGGMNNCKNQCGKGMMALDRTDWLFYALNELYEKLKIDNSLSELKNINEINEAKKKLLDLQGKEQIIICDKRNINDLILYDFINEIDNFDNYVNIFYHLDTSERLDRNLINDMIKLGTYEIEDIDSIDNYMNVAIAYWLIQRDKYMNLVNEYCENKESNI